MLKTTSRVLVCVLLCVAAGAATVRAQTPQPQVDPTPVYTICTLMVGAPPPSWQPQSTITLSASKLSALEAAEYVENVAELQDKLKSTFRLEQLDVVSSFGDWMSPGREMVLEEPSGALRLIVRAEGVTEPEQVTVRGADGTFSLVSRPSAKTANYSVQLASGANLIFKKAWSVPLGSRNILARQAEANGPLYFVVITVPAPGAPMQTILGFQMQGPTTGASSAVRGVAEREAGEVGRAVSAARGVSGGAERGVVVVDGKVGASGAGTIRGPKLIYSIRPTLSAEARAAGLKGPAILMGIIAEDGSVRDVKVLKGVEGLDDIAIAAFSRWRYEPAVDQNGKPMQVQVVIALVFKDELEDDR